jgi:hypothetical protein
LSERVVLLLRTFRGRFNLDEIAAFQTRDDRVKLADEERHEFALPHGPTANEHELRGRTVQHEAIEEVEVLVAYHLSAS